MVVVTSSLTPNLKSLSWGRVFTFAGITTSLLLGPALAWASPDSSRFEVRNGQGGKLGTLTVEVSTRARNKQACFDITRSLEIKESGVFFGTKREENERAIVCGEGLVDFTRTVRRGKELTTLRAFRQGDNLFLHFLGPKKKYSVAIPLDQFEMCDVEIDLPGSPFRDLKLKEGRRAQVVSMDRLAVITVVRNVNEERSVQFNGEDLPVYVVNTNWGGRVETAWYEKGTHRLIRKKLKDREWVRLKE